MVLKRGAGYIIYIVGFENDVEMYGAQAVINNNAITLAFENDVEMYGAQAPITVFARSERFENDVEMYGAQADCITLLICIEV